MANEYLYAFSQAKVYAKAVKMQCLVKDKLKSQNMYFLGRHATYPFQLTDQVNHFVKFVSATKQICII